MRFNRMNLRRKNEKAREGGCRAFSWRAFLTARSLVREQHNNGGVNKPFLSE